MSYSEESGDLAELVQKLHEPWSRRAARQKLVAARAVGTLLDCLDSTNESVVWAAIQSLGELRATEAVGPLVDLLERKVLILDVAEALSTITGEEFGADADLWRKWIGAPVDKSPAPADHHECMRRTGELLGAEPSGKDTSYRFTLSMPNDRTQKVAVYFGREDSDGGELVVIYSECGPASPKHYEAVLRKNMSIPAGAFAIRDVDDVATLVIVDTVLAASATARTLAKKIENIAARADLVEKGLTKKDTR
jgi:hypothetical protein